MIRITPKVWLLVGLLIMGTLSITYKRTFFITGKDRLPWNAPDTAMIPATIEGALIRYGRDLIARTAFYLGPQGTVAHVSNGMNCQNCHLQAGARPWGNNYGAVAATYPKFRERSGTVESIEKKINDCIERSLNGKPIDSTGLEMRAMVAYMKWLGKDTKKGKQPYGTGITIPPYLDRAASPHNGRKVYVQHCKQCHGINGEGRPDTTGSAGYLYPPLWGDHSYNTGAGIYRLSKFAGYVKSNMPFGISSDKPVLTIEEAWDVAAFVNSRPRPAKAFKEDWPDNRTKPADHPFGPFSDTFPAGQHKYGPFKPIQEAGRKPRP